MCNSICRLLVRHLGLACRLPRPSFGVTLSISLPLLHFSPSKGSENVLFKLSCLPVAESHLTLSRDIPLCHCFTDANHKHISKITVYKRIEIEQFSKKKKQDFPVSCLILNLASERTETRLMYQRNWTLLSLCCLTNV